jgi:outer membrane protein assembly factor BamB
LWTIALNNRIVAPPAYRGTRAFFSIDGDRLVAYELITGRQLWLVAAKNLRKPAVGDELIFSVDADGVTARSIDDGSERWKLALEEPLTADPVWENGWLILGTASGAVQAVRARDGGLVWSRNLPAPLHAPAAVAGDRVFLATADGNVQALRVDTGAPAWNKPFRVGDVPNEILALDTRIYVGSNDNYLYCLDAETGARVFRWGTGGDVVARPVIIDRTVYFASLDNILYALNAGSGSRRWAQNLPSRPIRGLVQAGNALLVSGLGGTIRSYHPTTGAPGAELVMEHTVGAPPAFLTGSELPAPQLLVYEVETTTVTAFGRSLEPPIVPLAQVQGLIAKTLGETPTKP